MCYLVRFFVHYIPIIVLLHIFRLFQAAYTRAHNMHIIVWYSNWLIAIFNFPTMPAHKMGYRHIDSYIQHSYVLSLWFRLRQFQLFFSICCYIYYHKSCIFFRLYTEIISQSNANRKERKVYGRNQKQKVKGQFWKCFFFFFNWKTANNQKDKFTNYKPTLNLLQPSKHGSLINM